MYCQQCGSQLDENGICPNCVPHVEAEKINKEEKNEGKPLLSKGTRSYAALLTAALVFPATFCTALDMSIHRYDFWFGYVVGALMVFWVCAVLPVMKITPAPITALICFTAIMGYVTFIIKKTGHLEWLYQRVLPLFVIFAVFVAFDVAFIGSKKIRGLHVLSVLCGQAAIYLVCIEANAHGWEITNLHWSPIWACAFISVVAVFEAFSYIGRINKK